MKLLIFVLSVQLRSFWKCSLHLDQHPSILAITGLSTESESLKTSPSPLCLFPLPLNRFSETFIRELCFSCCCVRDHLKLNISRNGGSRRSVISIISQRRTELNYQHGCVQTRAQLITLGWSPCCLCPRFARSQLTTCRFIAGTVQLPATPKLSSCTLPILTLSVHRGRNYGANSMHI